MEINNKTDLNNIIQKLSSSSSKLENSDVKCLYKEIRKTKEILLNMLEKYVNDLESVKFESIDYDKNYYLFPILFLSENKVCEAFELMIRAFSVNASVGFCLYENVCYDDLSSILYRTYNGNSKLLENYITSSKVDISFRLQGLMAYFKLASMRKIEYSIFSTFTKSLVLDCFSQEINKNNCELLTHIALYISEFKIFKMITLMKEIIKSAFFDETINGDLESYIDRLFTYNGYGELNNILIDYKFINQASVHHLYHENSDYSFNINENVSLKNQNKMNKKKKMISDYIDACKRVKPANIGKNDLCFCESGKKYKNCCMNVRDLSYVYTKFSDYYDLLIDYPNEFEVRGKEKGLRAFYSSKAIKMDKLFYKAFHFRNIPPYIPLNISMENLEKAGYIVDALEIALEIIKENKIINIDTFNEKFMIHYDIFNCINEGYKIIYDKNYPVPELGEHIKDLMLRINECFIK